jgi:hypothetical protein
MKKNEPKKFSLSTGEMSELSYLVQNQETYREMAAYWQHRVQDKQRGIEAGKAIDHEKFTVDWSNVFSEGMITCVPKPVVKTEEVKEEKK